MSGDDWPRRRRRNVESRALARRHGQPWTAHDLALLAATGALTAAELAWALGRTNAAVSEKRRRLRQEHA